jgi:hypothetical protein
VALDPNESQTKLLGVGTYFFPGQMDFHLRIDQEYIVYGLSILGGVPWIYIIGESGIYCYGVPLCLFEIIDGRVSGYWEIQVVDSDTLIWPHSFFQPFYHDDLTEGVLEVQKDFLRVKKLIDAEANS